METNAKMFRKDGQWVIELEIEQWVIDDMLFDVSRENPLGVEIFISANRESMGGATRWLGSMAIEKSEIVDTIYSEVVFDPATKDTNE